MIGTMVSGKVGYMVTSSLIGTVLTVLLVLGASLGALLCSALAALLILGISLRALLCSAFDEDSTYDVF